jgi:DNA-binding MarR family transcriptional regulator
MTNETDEIIHHWREAVPNDRLAHLLRDASRAFVRALQIRLNQHNVQVGHWVFLRVLWETDGLTQKELSTQVGVMEPTTFTAIKAMEAQGYVVRVHMPNNKKNMYVHLTRQGRALKKKLVPLAEEVNAISTADIAPDKVQIVRDVLLKMIENLAADENRKDD